MDTAVFPGRYESLGRISDYILAAARRAGLDETDCYAVQTAVDEASSNIIEHAYGGEGRGEITCSVGVEPTRLVVVLTDRGKSFDPASVPAPDLTARLFKRKEGGLGLFFIRKFMDEVIFERDPEGGNRLTLIKRRQKRD